MPQFDSIHTGEQVDEAVDIVLGNKSKGNSTTPVYLDSDGVAVAVTKDTTPTDGSTNPITSGAVFTGLGTKYSLEDISTNTSLGESDTTIVSSNAAKTYIENKVAAMQTPISAGENVVLSNNTLSVSKTSPYVTQGDLDNKWSYCGNQDIGRDGKLSDIIDRAKHSTFDLSKFTVEGTPVITSDGIASGFSSSNYIEKSLSLSNSINSIKIKGLLDVPNISETCAAFTAVNSSNKEALLNIDSSSNQFRITESIGFASVFFNNISLAGITKIIYQLEVDITNSNLTLKVTDALTGITQTQTQTASSNILTVFSNLSYIRIGKSVTGFQTWYDNITEDLKQFSITVDGVPVFSGNKTGIDTIKADDYTVVGSPTISDDGIASGFSNDDYIKKENAISFSNTDEIVIKSKFKVKTSQLQALYVIDAFNKLSVLIGATNYVSSYFGTSNGYAAVSSHAVELGKEYMLEQVFNGGRYQMFLTDIASGVKYDGSITNISDTFSYTDLSLFIGQAHNMSTGHTAFTGSIDLNSFEIYKNGSLVYQPLLRIPYTLTSQGNKIVDVQYKSRVEDEYNQAGYIPYDVLETETTEDFVKVGTGLSIVDGIASGFSGSNYLRIPNLSLESANSWTINGAFSYTGGVNLLGGAILSVNSGNGLILAVDRPVSDIKFGVFLSSVSGSWNIYQATNSDTIGYTANAIYKFSISFNGIKYKISCINTSTNEEFSKEIASTTKVYQSPTQLGLKRNANDAYFQGSIDLKSFKIYIDGKLVYTPYKKPYYELATIKEANVVSTYANGSNQTRKFANQFIKMQGTCTADTAVTFPNSVSFIDTNYFLSVPGVKTKTGFTPTVTGDWIAEGYTSL